MTTILSHNPANGDVLGEVAVYTAKQISEALQRSRQAQKLWQDLSFAERKKYLLKFRDLVFQNIDELALLISKENGKPLVEAIGNDIVPSLDFVTYFAKHAAKLLKNEKLCLGKWNVMGRKSHLEYYPYGVVGIIAPWNFPFSIPVGQIAMALMAGNTVLFKPSEWTSLVGVKIGELMKQAGLPSGVLEVITGDGQTGASLVASGVDKISFTGSVNTGKKIMEACSKTLTPVTLELGGKDPMIIFADADLDVASSAAVWGAFCNSGQICASVERLYVHESVADAFIDLVVKKTKSLRQGLGQSYDIDVAAMTSKMQIDKVVEHVEDAKTRGAHILTGGQQLPGGGFFYPPTVLTNVDHSFLIVREETFGPVLPIMTFQTEAEVIQKANDSVYALNAYIWTKNITLAKRVASQIIAGTVNINDSVFSFAVPQTPWGGPKQSGIGHTHGNLGLKDLVRVRHVHQNTMTAKRNFFWWFAYSANSVLQLKSLATALFGKGFARVSALGRFVKLALKTKVS